MLRLLIASVDDGKGNVSSGRIINLFVAVCGSIILGLTAWQNQVDWPWAFCFIGYLAYGAGTNVFSKWLDVIGAKSEGNKQP